MAEYRKPNRSQVVYLHLKPGYYSGDLVVSKMAKTKDVEVEPGVVIVKAKVTVPGNFFDEAMPFTAIEFQPGDELQPQVEIDADREAQR